MKRVAIASSVLALVVAALAVGAAQAHDDENPNPRPGRVAKDGSILPEQEPTHSPRSFQEIYDTVNPAGRPGVLVCGDQGDDQATVVFEYRVGEKAQQDPAFTAPNAEIQTAPDPCAGKSVVVGR